MVARNEVRIELQATGVGVGAVGLARVPDRDLLYLVSRGDLHALEQIYDRHIGVVWTAALAFSDNAASAEQAVSAVFLGLWRRPEPGERTSLSARLLSSVRREAGASQRVLRRWAGA